MMAIDPGWLRAEAERLGLRLSDADLSAVRAILEAARSAVAAARRALPESEDGIEVFPPPGGGTPEA